MPRRLLSVDDLGAGDAESLLARATELAAGAAPRRSWHQAAVAFFETSLRTRTGYMAAAQRLGWPTPVDVGERRSSKLSMTESLGDTFAVLGSYFDTLLIRMDKPAESVLPHVPDAVSIVNCGDRGPRGEHPTQALIDVFAMTELVGVLSGLHVGLVGDLRMRSARSLLKLFARLPPGQLTLISHETLTWDLDLPPDLGPHVMVAGFDETSDLDVINAVGIPHLGATEDVRTRLRVDKGALGSLSSRGRVLSPMPVIDEVAQAVRADARVVYLKQSAMAQHLRTAVLESLT